MAASAKPTLDRAEAKSRIIFLADLNFVHTVQAEVGEEELLTIAADVHERDREEAEAVDHVDVEEQALVVTLCVVLPRVHGRVEEVDAIEGNGEGGDEDNRGDQEAGPDEVAVDDAAVVVKDDGGGEVEEAAAVDGERAERDTGVAGLDELALPP